MADESHILLESIAAGDGKAFAALFRIWYPKVKVFLVRFINDEKVAEDLTQDIFIRIWTFGPSLTEIRKFDTYLFRMTRNAALNYLRDRKGNLNVMDLSLMDDVGIEELYYRQEKILIMRMLVEKMPPQRQKVFKLSRMNGFSNDKIAEILGISKKTVENHLTDALRTLREALA